MLGAHDNSGGSDWVCHKLLTSVHVMLTPFLLSWGQMGGRDFKIPQGTAESTDQFPGE